MKNQKVLKEIEDKSEGGGGGRGGEEGGNTHYMKLPRSLKKGSSAQNGSDVMLLIFEVDKLQPKLHASFHIFVNLKISYKRKFDLHITVVR